MQVNSKVFKYSVHYFLSVSFYSFLLGFFPLYCKDLGYTSFEIAMIAASATIATIIGPPALLQLAHNLVSPRVIFWTGGIVALAVFLLMSAANSFYYVAPIWFACILVKRGCDSLVDAQTLRDSSNKELRFEKIRLWGSFGFIATSSITGMLFDTFGSASVLPSGAANLLFIAIWGFILAPLLPGTVGKLARPRELSSKAAHSAPRSVFLLAVTSIMLLSASHSVLYGYLSLYLRALGWSGALISAAWNIGVLAEIVFFFLFFQLEKHLSLSRIFQLSVGAAIVRWLVLVFCDSQPIILISQVLHAFTFGGSYLASLKIVHQILPDHLKDRGQGALIAFGQGVGSLFGYFAAGLGASLLVSDRDLNLLFIGAAALALLSLLISARLPHIDPKTAAEEPIHKSLASL